MIKYMKGNLFDASYEYNLIHAVNCQGVWGSGIAKQFREMFPENFEFYKEHCDAFRSGLIGTGIVGSRVGWLYTSIDYGNKKDSVEEIKINTALALDDLFKHARKIGVHQFASNKFNSGLFSVPWKETELILLTLLKRYPEMEWIVYDPDL